MELFKIINYNNLFFNEKFYDFLKTMQPVSIAQIKKQADIVNFSKHDKENFIKTCNILVKNPQQDNIYFDEFKETLKYFSRFYKIGSNYNYQYHNVGTYFPWHTDEHMNELASIIIPLNKDGKGTLETIYKHETFTRSYTETIYLNTTLKHRTSPILEGYAYLRLPIIL